MILHTTIQNQASVYLFPVAGDGEVEQKHCECQQLGDGEGEPDAVGAGDTGHEEEGRLDLDIYDNAVIVLANGSVDLAYEE